MPRVPNYQPNQVPSVRPNGARLQAVDDGGGAFGAISQGLQQIGQQGAQGAADWDEHQSKNDDTQARQIAADKGLALSNLLQQYKLTEAGAARAGQQGFNDQTKVVWENALEEATTPRMRQFVEQRLNGVYQSAQEQGYVHALQGARAERAMAFDATSASWAQQAVNTDDETQRDAFIASGVTSVLDKSREIDGIDAAATPEIAQQKALAFTSKVHEAVGDRMFAKPYPDTAQITAYVLKYRDQMSPDVRAQFMARLREPLKNRMIDERANLVGAELQPETGSKPVMNVGGVEGYVHAVRARESGGNDNAKNPRSSATGRYQFTTSTWLDYYKRRYGGANLSDAQILAKRGDGDVQDQLMADLTNDNSKALKDAGISASPGNLYLAHFAGATGAKKVLQANPDTPVADLLGKEVIRSNPHLVGMSAGDLKAWAGGVVGGNGAAYSSAPREWNRAQIDDAVNRAAQKHGWSPEETEDVRAAWDKRAARDEGLLREQYASASDDYEQFVAKLPDGRLDRVDQIPAALRAKMDPTQLAKEQQVIKQREAKEREEAAEAAALQQGILAGVVDPSDANVRKAGDALYAKDMQAAGSMAASKKMAFDIAFVSKVGFVPPALKGQLVGQLRSAVPEQQAYAASIISEIGARNSAILNDFSEEQIARARQLSYYRDSGFSDKEAAQKVTDLERAPKAERDGRRAQFDGLAKKAGEASDILEGNFGYKATPTLIGRFNGLWQSEFERTGDIEVAKSTALAAMRKEWSVSRINGDAQVMRYAPERYYGVSDKGQADAKWIREQAVTELLSGGMSAPNAEGRFRLQPYGTVNGQPVYIGVLQQEDGTIVTLSDTMGRPKKWKPDYSKSEEAKRQQDRRAGIVGAARQRRAAATDDHGAAGNLLLQARRNQY